MADTSLHATHLQRRPPPIVRLAVAFGASGLLWAAILGALRLI
ncbi:hypothetical protein [Phenylobacterium sp.]